MMNVRKRTMGSIALLIFCGSLYGAEPTASPGGTPREVDWPTTLAATRAQAFFKAGAAPDDEPMREFQKANRSPESLQETPLEARVAKARSLGDQVGELEIAKIETDGEFKVAVIAKSSKLGLWMRFNFVFGPDSPHYIVSMQGTPTGPPDQAPLTHDPASNLTQLLEQAKQRSGLPALAVAYIRDGRVQDAAAIGVRHVDRGDPVQIDDRFHVGSVGKAMTASVIAKLIEDGRLRWESKVSEVLSDVAMRPEYRDVTLEQLLQHRGGIPPYTDDIPEARMKTLKSAGTPMQQRAAFIAQVLNEPPTVPPGTVMIYSNAGYALAGHMAERVTKKSWEEIMTTMLFPSLGMSGSGLGWPATAARPDQPYGHFDSLPNLRVQGLDDYEFGHFLTPAGDVHCTVKDLARFVAFHLEGLRGQDGWLKAETIRRLHRPPGTHRPAYAGGWMVEEPAGGKARHWHVGSAGTFFASVALYPDDGVAIVGLSNAGFPANPVLDEVTRAVMKMSGLNPTNEAK